MVMKTEDNPVLGRIRIVLVETQDAANIGSVCRAMKTMGITRLVMVGDPANYDDVRVRTLALHAYDLYEQAEWYPALSRAVAGSVLAIGATRRRGKFRKYFSVTPEQLAERITDVGEGDVSIVFGREADGLTDEELHVCNMAVRIPTSEIFPSLNLAQAVQIICYVLRRDLMAGAPYEPISLDRLDEVVATITDSYERIGFYKKDERREVARFYRDILARAGLSQRESQRLEKMFNKMANIKIHLG